MEKGKSARDTSAYRKKTEIEIEIPSSLSSHHTMRDEIRKNCNCSHVKILSHLFIAVCTIVTVTTSQSDMKLIEEGVSLELTTSLDTSEEKMLS